MASSYFWQNRWTHESFTGWGEKDTHGSPAKRRALKDERDSNRVKKVKSVLTTLLFKLCLNLPSAVSVAYRREMSFEREKTSCHKTCPFKEMSQPWGYQTRLHYLRLERVTMMLFYLFCSYIATGENEFEDAETSSKSYASSPDKDIDISLGSPALLMEEKSCEGM